MKLSVLIPAHNKEGNLSATVHALYDKFMSEKIAHEILVVNDHSTDGTTATLEALCKEVPSLRLEENQDAPGFGHAVRWGLARFTGDCVAIVMADLSDSPEDVARFYWAMREGGVDCVFGSRFIKGGAVINYPAFKLALNRFANMLTKLVFGVPYNDFTNAFKLYRRETIQGLQPLLSAHFNLTLEMPLKAIVRGYTYQVLPNRWTNRKHGESKLKIQEMGSRYFFILLYCLIEKYFSRGDFKKKY